jgi:class 3 adenylate cyclase/tetratricopeptide (TPR) repeat protein
MSTHLDTKVDVLRAALAYVPMDRRLELLTGNTVPTRSEGTALFADICGFTPMTERLAREVGPHRAGEELSRILDAIYGPMIGAVHAQKGSVIGFAGDAITCWFDGDDGHRAITSGLDMLARIARLTLPESLAGGPPIAIKVAVTRGVVERAVIGDPQIQVFDAIVGPPIERLAVVDSVARKDELLVCSEVLAKIGDELTIGATYEAPTGERFTSITRIAHPHPPNAESDFALEHVASELARPWLLAPVFERLANGHGGLLAEFRSAAALFVGFRGIGDIDDTQEFVDGVAKLDGLVQWVQQVVSRHGGFVIQLTIGDKGLYLYAAFGAPIAHEHVVRRALSAALELAAPPKDLEHASEPRIGVGYGRMWTGAYGSDLQRTYGVLGDETNTAARLMGKAQPGQILVSPPVLAASEGRFRFEPLGELALKGKRSIAVHMLSSRVDWTSVRPPTPETQMVGRREQRAVLHDLVARLPGSGAIEPIVVEGEAGLGKSMIVTDLVTHASSQLCRVLIGTADPTERATPFYAWRPVFSALVEDTAGKELVSKLKERLSPELVELLPLAGSVLGVDMPESALTSHLRGPARASRTLEFLARLFADLRGPLPALLIIEDAHWLDSSSWALLERVRDTGIRLGIVVTTRPASEVTGALAAHLSGARMLRLEAIQLNEMLEIVRQRLHAHEIGPEVADIIHSKAEGNPFFAEELALALRDAGIIVVDSGVCRLVGVLDEASLPTTVEGVVTSRIDRLSPGEQLTLKVASVIGRVFDLAALEEVYPVPRERIELPDRLEQLARSDLASRDSSNTGRYTFRHAVTQDVAYGMMLFEHRRALHHAVAEWIERRHANDVAAWCGALAYHRWKSIEGVTDPDAARVEVTCRALLRAGEHASNQGASQEALTHLERALDLLRHLPAARERDALELDIRAALGAVLVAISGPDSEQVRAGFQRMRELCEILGAQQRLFDALFGLWYSHLTNSDPRAVPLATQLLEVAERTHHPVTLFLARQARGATAICSGHYSEGLEFMQSALRLAEETLGRSSELGSLGRVRDPRVVSHCYCAWADWFLGFAERSLADVQRAIELAGRDAHPATLTEALCFGALVHRFRREPDEALPLAERALALATEQGLPFWRASALSVRAWIALEAGDIEDAFRYLKECIPRVDTRAAMPLVTIFAYTDLIEAYCRVENWDEATRALANAHSITASRLAGFWIPEVHRMEAEVHRRRGQLDLAEASARRAMELAMSQGAHALALRAAITLARISKGAKEPLRKLLSMITEGHTTPDLVEAASLI